MNNAPIYMLITKLSSVATIFLLVLALPASAVDSGNADEAERFRSVNDIVSVLNPLDVIANHDGVRRSIDLDIQFALGSAQLLPAAKIQIEALAQALLSNRLDGYNINIIGHTDITGSAENNLSLSALRAKAVRASIIDYGVSASRLSAEGKGETQLIRGLAPADPKHRRVQIVAIAVQEAVPAVKKFGSETEIEQDGEQKINW